MFGGGEIGEILFLITWILLCSPIIIFCTGLQRWAYKDIPRVTNKQRIRELETKVEAKNSLLELYFDTIKRLTDDDEHKAHEEIDVQWQLSEELVV